MAEYPAEKGRIGVIGAGSWGTTLANLLAEKGVPIDLWVFEEELFQARQSKTDKVYEILYEGKNPREAVAELMARDPRFEQEVPNE